MLDPQPAVGRATAEIDRAADGQPPEIGGIGRLDPQAADIEPAVIDGGDPANYPIGIAAHTRIDPRRVNHAALVTKAADIDRLADAEAGEGTGFRTRAKAAECLRGYPDALAQDLDFLVTGIHPGDLADHFVADVYGTGDQPLPRACVPPMPRSATAPVPPIPPP